MLLDKGCHPGRPWFKFYLNNPISLCSYLSDSFNPKCLMEPPCSQTDTTEYQLQGVGRGQKVFPSGPGGLPRASSLATAGCWTRWTLGAIQQGSSKGPYCYFSILLCLFRCWENLLTPWMITPRPLVNYPSLWPRHHRGHAGEGLWLMLSTSFHYETTWWPQASWTHPVSGPAILLASFTGFCRNTGIKAAGIREVGLATFSGLSPVFLTPHSFQCSKPGRQLRKG